MLADARESVILMTYVGRRYRVLRRLSVPKFLVLLREGVKASYGVGLIKISSEMEFMKVRFS
jgi:hypothetical protein